MCSKCSARSWAAFCRLQRYAYSRRSARPRACFQARPQQTFCKVLDRVLHASRHVHSRRSARPRACFQARPQQTFCKAQGMLTGRPQHTLCKAQGMLTGRPQHTLCKAQGMPISRPQHTLCKAQGMLPGTSTADVLQASEVCL